MVIAYVEVCFLENFVASTLKITTGVKRSRRRERSLTTTTNTKLREEESFTNTELNRYGWKNKYMPMCPLNRKKGIFVFLSTAGAELSREIKTPPPQPPRANWKIWPHFFLSVCRPCIRRFYWQKIRCLQFVVYKIG